MTSASPGKVDSLTVIRLTHGSAYLVSSNHKCWKYIVALSGRYQSRVRLSPGQSAGTPAGAYFAASSTTVLTGDSLTVLWANGEFYILSGDSALRHSRRKGLELVSIDPGRPLVSLVTMKRHQRSEDVGIVWEPIVRTLQNHDRPLRAVR